MNKQNLPKASRIFLVASDEEKLNEMIAQKACEGYVKIEVGAAQALLTAYRISGAQAFAVMELS